MKTFFIFLAAFFLAGGLFSVNAQDMIILKTGDEIEAKVTEISPSEIKYKRFNNLEGPVVVIPADRVFMIKYENGTREIVNAENTAPAAGANTQNSVSDSKAKKAQDNKGAAFGLNFLLGSGIGSFVQGDNIGGTIGLIGDITGWTLVIVSSVITNVVDDSDTKKWDTYNTNLVSGYLTSGLIVLSGARFFQLIKPFTYANSFNVAFSPVIDNNGQPALAAAVQLKF